MGCCTEQQPDRNIIDLRPGKCQPFSPLTLRVILQDKAALVNVRLLLVQNLLISRV